MFGRGMKISCLAVPEWMEKIASEFGVFVHWFPSKTHCYGCANVRGTRTIELHTHADGASTSSAVMVLLHEIAHVLAPDKSSNVQNVRSGFHGIRFWIKAAYLYRRWGLLEYASRHDGYKCGRDFLAKLIQGELGAIATTPDGGVWQLDHEAGEAFMVRRKPAFEYRHVMTANGVGKIVKKRLTLAKS